MNYLAATLMKVIDDEEDAFWTFCNLIEVILPLDYYSQMVEVIIDQAVFVSLFQHYKPKLFKHLQNMGLDVAIVLFQWFVCVFSSQLNDDVTQTIWDFLFLEGTVTLFRASLAILSILENELLDAAEFSDVYQILNTQPWEVINNSYLIITYMDKFLEIDTETIHFLRGELRDEITKEQRKVWQANARSK